MYVPVDKEEKNGDWQDCFDGHETKQGRSTLGDKKDADIEEDINCNIDEIGIWVRRAVIRGRGRMLADKAAE